jgi:hypothetical protein
LFNFCFFRFGEIMCFNFSRLALFLVFSFVFVIPSSCSLKDNSKSVNLEKEETKEDLDFLFYDVEPNVELNNDKSVNEYASRGKTKDNWLGDKNKSREVERKDLTSVMNLSDDNVRTYLKISGGKKISCEMDGKFRFDSAYGVNTRYLNDKNHGLDKYIVFGKSTVDLGFSFARKHDFESRNIFEAALKIRSRSVWGKPDEIVSTTDTEISDGAYSFGKHKHNIGVPALYVRGFDLTFDLNSLFGVKDRSLHFFKMGFFPFELGRGISLGAAYNVAHEFITFDAGNVIQEFAPGFMLYGSFDKKKRYSYRSYLGILKSYTASLSDVNFPADTKEYGRKLSPQRGFGIANIVWANQFDWICNPRVGHKARISPYLMVYHEGESQNNFIANHWNADFTTLGMEFVAEGNKFEFGCEFAKNIGQQNVIGIDRNVISREQRQVTLKGEDAGGSDITNKNSVANVMTNKYVTFIGDSNTTDLKDKNAVYISDSHERQKAINSVYQSATQNGENISYISSNGKLVTELKNASDRFRDPYKNLLRGWMFVSDLSYKFNVGNTVVRGALSVGCASGDENPNGPLKTPDDYMHDAKYQGFIGIQEIYSGKKVKSVFLMSGAGQTPRVLSVPSDKYDSSGTGKKGMPMAYPSKISRFTNLAYFGGSLDFKLEYTNYTWKFNPNVLYYMQMRPTMVLNETFANNIGTNRIPSSLGLEANIFVECAAHKISGLKFFGVATMFVPGDYYRVLKKIPLDAKDYEYRQNIKNGIPTAFVPTMGNDLAYYINIGLEYVY